MRPNGADGSASPEAAQSSRYTEGLRERFEPRGKGPAIWRSILFCDGGSARVLSRHLRNADPDANEISSFLSFPHDRLDCVCRHSFHACQKSPLILVRTKFRIDKNTVPLCTRNLLERQGDQIAKTSFGHRVLIRKESVVRIQPHLVAGLHGSSEDCTAQFSRHGSGNRSIKNIHTWPPFPDRERSKTAGTFISRQATRNEAASFCQVFLSKSTARSQQVSSCKSG